jgi:hypothetical protein
MTYPQIHSHPHYVIVTFRRAFAMAHRCDAASLLHSITIDSGRAALMRGNTPPPRNHRVQRGDADA